MGREVLNKASPLTYRETIALELVEEGLSLQEISDVLSITYNNLTVYMHGIRNKFVGLGLFTREELQNASKERNMRYLMVEKAKKHGWLT